MSTVPPPPVSLDNSWCPVDRPYPPSYEAAQRHNPDECVAVDPCTDSGTTLWKITECTTTIVAVEPEELPSCGHECAAPALPPTGSTVAHDVGFGGALIVVALVLAAVSHRRRARR